MEAMIRTLVTAAQTSPADAWKVGLKRMLLAVAVSLAFLGVSAQ
jgi:hypothetical protein